MLVLIDGLSYAVLREKHLNKVRKKGQKFCNYNW